MYLLSGIKQIIIL